MMHHILVVGVGSIGERHVRCLKATGRADVGICEINGKLRMDVAERYAIQSAFEGLEEALSKRWDAVVIATPAHLHVSQAIACARAGRHLFIEKPLSTSVQDIPALQSELSARELVAAVAYVYRAHPALGAMRQALISGNFGKPVQIIVAGGQHFPLYRPAYRQIYYRDRATGGGAIQDALTHLVNAAEWIIGPVTWVAADASHKILDGVDVEDTVNAIARHGDVMASYSLNQHQAPNETSITVVAERGTLRFEVQNTRWRWMKEPGDAWHDENFGPLERDDWFIFQERAFLDALERRCAPLCSLEEGLQTLRVNQAMLQSAAQGSSVIAIEGATRKVSA